jgi:glucose/arabinose dehydrogenase
VLTRPVRLAGRAAAAALVILALAGPAGGALPPNFVDQQVAIVGGPTALAFTPDGRLLITTQGGTLRVYQNGALVGTPALTFPSAQICSDFERGLLGVAVDPDFANNNYIYLFYTFRNGAGTCSGSTTPKNRVSRFVLPANNTVSLASETILVDNMPSPNGNHNGGDVQFGKDGHLYIAVGDGGCDYNGDSGCAGSNNASRDEHTLTGKILRITASGGIPADNPFQGAGTARCNVTGGTTPGNRCQETFAWGLRNPFRMAFDPNAPGTVFRINDVGQNVWEEIDLGQSGADYGWNCREGAHTNSTTGPCSPTPPGMVDPIFEYRHNLQIPGTTSTANCNAITGGAFVPNGIWPASYDGTYLFSDYTCGWVARLSSGGPPFTAQDFATALGGSSVVAMVFGPHGTTQALYYTTFSGTDQVRRIFYSVSGNNAPTAMLEGSPLGGPAPLTVDFDASDSSDPDADPLTYIWDFGDGTPETTTTTPTIQHTFTAPGVRTVTLRVRDDNFAFSTPVTLTVQPGNNLPVPSIGIPTASQTFSVGELVNLTGSATDAENGPLAADRLSWTVVLHHAAHTHPFLGPVTGSPVPMTCPPPEDLAATDNSYLEVILTATDLDNLSATVTRNFQPLKVPITVQTSPPGLTIPVNGFDQVGPSTFTSWAAYVLNVNAPDQSLGNDDYVWVSWSDGGARAHAITTPAVATTYTANFQLAAPVGLDYFAVPPCRLVDTRGAAGPLGGPALTCGPSAPSRTFDLDGLCLIPATARALALNVTVAQPSAQGDLRVYPQGGAQPNSSVINFRAGQARANNAVALLGPTGAVSVYCGMAAAGTTHFIVDVVGYFQE